MPTVLRDGPYRFYFYSNEQHEPPHVHVIRERRIAKFWLVPVRLAVNSGFNAFELRRMERIVRKHQARFVESWNDHLGS